MYHLSLLLMPEPIPTQEEEQLTQSCLKSAVEIADEAAFEAVTIGENAFDAVAGADSHGPQRGATGLALEESVDLRRFQRGSRRS